ncbi:hypothetical protein T03_1872 [Trichinella britovi]|uniref:Uncharacterized protein n=2 Tax=Trichinella TaxID=6333 RepID=A0A0V1DC95_TRIBR|nr:hypothetical protein T05_6865 [Trichinella murrelli]KRY59289.1 hypothetical protein T03_1872 [Trichinella britovi]
MNKYTTVLVGTPQWLNSVGAIEIMIKSNIYQYSHKIVDCNDHAGNLVKTIASLTLAYTYMRVIDYLSIIFIVVVQNLNAKEILTDEKFVEAKMHGRIRRDSLLDETLKAGYDVAFLKSEIMKQQFQESQRRLAPFMHRVIPNIPIIPANLMPISETGMLAKQLALPAQLPPVHKHQPDISVTDFIMLNVYLTSKIDLLQKQLNILTNKVLAIEKKLL